MARAVGVVAYGSKSCSWCGDKAIWEIRARYGSNFQYACDYHLTDINIGHEYTAHELREGFQKRLV